MIGLSKGSLRFFVKLIITVDLMVAGYYCAVSCYRSPSCSTLSCVFFNSLLCPYLIPFVSCCLDGLTPPMIDCWNVDLKEYVRDNGQRWTFARSNCSIKLIGWWHVKNNNISCLLILIIIESLFNALLSCFWAVNFYNWHRFSSSCRLTFKWQMLCWKY